MKKTLRCEQCQRDVEIVLEESGPHTKASCIECGKYIKFISQKELEGNMSDVEITVPVEGSQYNELIVIEKYGDQYSLVLGGKSKAGNVFKKWCFPQGPDKQPREKGVPWKIPLGNATEAKTTVAGIARAFGIIPGSNESDTISDHERKAYSYDPEPPEDGVPF